MSPVDRERVCLHGIIGWARYFKMELGQRSRHGWLSGFEVPIWAESSGRSLLPVTRPKALPLRCITGDVEMIRHRCCGLRPRPVACCKGGGAHGVRSAGPNSRGVEDDRLALQHLFRGIIADWRGLDFEFHISPIKCTVINNQKPISRKFHICFEANTGGISKLISLRGRLRTLKGIRSRAE